MTNRDEFAAEMRERWEKEKTFIRSLPEYEQDLFDLYYVKELTQKDIARMVGITQGAVSSRLTRMRRRLQFLKTLSNFDIGGMDENLRNVLDPLDRQILKAMAETTCQTEVARRVNTIFNLSGKRVMNQVKVRHRFFKAINKLKELDSPEYKDYLTLFQLIQKNLYVLHEVKLPHYDRG